MPASPTVRATRRDTTSAPARLPLVDRRGELRRRPAEGDLAHRAAERAGRGPTSRPARFSSFRREPLAGDERFGIRNAEVAGRLATAAKKASTTLGENCVPLCSRTSSKASSMRRARWYGRSIVIASQASANPTIVARSGMSSRRGARDSRRPSARGGGAEWGRTRSRPNLETMRALARVAFNELVLVLGEPVRLRQEDVRDRDLADVVEEAAGGPRRGPSGGFRAPARWRRRSAARGASARPCTGLASTVAF